MLAGAALLAIAYATILGTFVAVVRIDQSGIGHPVWQRLWQILTAWHFDAHPEVYRAAYAVILTSSSVLLYVMAYWADIRFQETFYTSGYLLASRVAIVFGEIFVWSGMGYCMVYTFDAMRSRAVLRLLIFSFLLVVSLSLLILNMFAFIGQWPPFLAWLRI